MTSPSGEDSAKNRILVKSIIVGAIGVAFATIYLIDGSPNDSNVGFWLYAPTSLVFLWPYQVLLALRLRTVDLPVTKYSGVFLSVLSVLMTTGIW